MLQNKKKNRKMVKTETPSQFLPSVNLGSLTEVSLIGFTYPSMCARVLPEVHKK